MVIPLDRITDWPDKFSTANTLPHIYSRAFQRTAASTMIANGVDLVTAATELEYTNITTPANIYACQVTRARAKTAMPVRESLHRSSRHKKTLCEVLNLQRFFCSSFWER